MSGLLGNHNFFCVFTRANKAEKERHYATSCLFHKQVCKGPKPTIRVFGSGWGERRGGGWRGGEEADDMCVCV